MILRRYVRLACFESGADAEVASILVGKNGGKSRGKSLSWDDESYSYWGMWGSIEIEGFFQPLSVQGERNSIPILGSKLIQTCCWYLF